MDAFIRRHTMLADQLNAAIVAKNHRAIALQSGSSRRLLLLFSTANNVSM
jgi:hypothetical protein